MASFMAVTLHWIARSQTGGLELKTALGGFRHMDSEHTGKNIGDEFVKVLDGLRILDKIGGITMDNASNCNSAVEALQEHMLNKGIPFDAEQQRIRCFSHVINLAVHEGLKKLTKADDFTADMISDPLLRQQFDQFKHLNSDAAGLKSDLVHRVSELVRQLRSSGQRCSTLRELILENNRRKWSTEPLPVLELLRQVVMRWSSTFLMVDRFLVLSPVSIIISHDLFMLTAV
jgi:hypothetical protein